MGHRVLVNGVDREWTPALTTSSSSLSTLFFSPVRYTGATSPRSRRLTARRTRRTRSESRDSARGANRRTTAIASFRRSQSLVRHPPWGTIGTGRKESESRGGSGGPVGAPGVWVSRTIQRRRVPVPVGPTLSLSTETTGC